MTRGERRAGVSDELAEPKWGERTTHAMPNSCSGSLTPVLCTEPPISSAGEARVVSYTFPSMTRPPSPCQRERRA